MFAPFSEAWTFLKGMTVDQDPRIQAHRKMPPKDNRPKKQFIRNTLMDLINRRDEITPETNPELFDRKHPRFLHMDDGPEGSFDPIFETLVDRGRYGERVPKKVGHQGLQQEELDTLARIIFGGHLDSERAYDKTGQRQQPLSEEDIRMIQFMHDRMKMDYPDVDMTRQPGRPDTRLLDKDPTQLLSRDREARKLAEKRLEEYNNQMAANMAIDSVMGLDEMIPDSETQMQPAELQEWRRWSGDDASRLGGRTNPDKLDAMGAYDELMSINYHGLENDEDKQRYLDSMGRNQVPSSYDETFGSAGRPFGSAGRRFDERQARFDERQAKTGF
ncbi:MAG: hypothetical protein CMF55_00140 [Legionellales bacterium]|nr:hypothetical protein [Legionellales bacterium]|tara:strand:- start:9409 stop:10401 length:993 start_codon:yes stop_codon:yes gene_type:complete